MRWDDGANFLPQGESQCGVGSSLGESWRSDGSSGYRDDDAVMVLVDPI